MDLCPRRCAMPACIRSPTPARAVCVVRLPPLCVRACERVTRKDVACVCHTLQMAAPRIMTTGPASLQGKVIYMNGQPFMLQECSGSDVSAS